MSLLLTIFSDAFTVLSRYFTLVYVFFVYLLVLGVLIPKGAIAPENPFGDPVWLAMMVVMALLTFAFLSGWFSMIARACLTFVSRKTTEKKPTEPGYDPTLPVLDSFRLLRDFFPGVGNHFPQFILGGCINLAVLFGIVYLLESAAESMPQAVAIFNQIQATQGSQAKAQELVSRLSLEEMQAFVTLSMMFLGGFVVYGLFMLLTMFWPAFVIFHNKNALSAYGRSILQFFRDPFRIIAIGLFFVVGHFGLTFLLYSPNPIILTLLQFLLMLLEIYTIVLLFVYVLHRIGKPEPKPLDAMQDEKANPA